MIGLLSSSIDNRPQFLSAGAVPSTGSPNESYPPGAYDFVTHLLILGADPIINRASFPGRLSETIRELVIGATSDASFNAVVKGGATNVMVPAPIALRLARVSLAGGAAWTAYEVGGFFGGLTTGSIPAALTTAYASALTAGVATYAGTADRLGPMPVTGHWITITGRLVAAATWTTASLNRAIARAFANNVTWQNVVPAYRSGFPAPNDGNPLLSALNDSDACSGGSDYSKVYAAACTRIGVATVSNAAPPPPVTTMAVLGPSAPGAASYAKPTAYQTHPTTQPLQSHPTTIPTTAAAPPAQSNTGKYLAIGVGAISAAVAIATILLSGPTIQPRKKNSRRVKRANPRRRRRHPR